MKQKKIISSRSKHKKQQKELRLKKLAKQLKLNILKRKKNSR